MPRNRALKPKPTPADLKDRQSLSITEAAILTGTSRTTVNNMLDEGKWRTTMIGKRRRVVTASIYEYDQQFSEPPEAA